MVEEKKLERSDALQKVKELCSEFKLTYGECISFLYAPFQSDPKLTQIPGIPHQHIFSCATYAPWITDEKFRRLYSHLYIKKSTLVDVCRLYELRLLALQASRLNGDFLEVGVWRGGSGAIIQDARKEAGHVGNFYMADTFQGVVKARSEKDPMYKGGEHSNASMDDVKKLFGELGLSRPDVFVLVGTFPEDYLDIDIESLAFVHSDVDTYQSTKDMIEWCLPKMARGGIMVFDDYGITNCEGVTRYVNELYRDTQFRSRFTFVYNLNGHAVLIKR